MFFMFWSENGRPTPFTFTQEHRNALVEPLAFTELVAARTGRQAQKVFTELRALPPAGDGT